MAAPLLSKGTDMLAPVRTVAPAAPILTLDEAKAHLRVDHADEDVLITGLIEAATAHLDGYQGILGQALITQTWSVEFARFANRIDVPLWPIQSASIQYYDSANALQTLSASVYAVLSDGMGPYVALRYNQQWPQTWTRDDAVKVTFVAGYGAAATSVPMAIRAAMLLLIGHWYDNRSTVSVGEAASEMPVSAAALLAPFRRVGT
jgi:uncharacterized phiE125 gp8 family phage protein